MQIQTKSTASNKITYWKGIAAFLSLMGIAFSPLKNKKSKAVRLLTREGKPVEIDEDLLVSYRNKISNKALGS